MLERVLQKGSTEEGWFEPTGGMEEGGSWDLAGVMLDGGRKYACLLQIHALGFSLAEPGLVQGTSALAALQIV